MNIPIWFQNLLVFKKKKKKERLYPKCHNHWNKLKVWKPTLQHAGHSMLTIVSRVLGGTHMEKSVRKPGCSISHVCDGVQHHFHIDMLCQVLMQPAPYAETGSLTFRFHSIPSYIHISKFMSSKDAWLSVSQEFCVASSYRFLRPLKPLAWRPWKPLANRPWKSLANRPWKSLAWWPWKIWTWRLWQPWLLNYRMHGACMHVCGYESKYLVFLNDQTWDIMFYTTNYYTARFVSLTG